MLALLPSAALAAALLVVLALHSRAIRHLREELEARDAGPTASEPARAPRFGAIYAERSRPLDALRQTPGGPALVAAGALIILQFVTGAVTRGGRDRELTGQATQLAAVSARLDSMGTTVAQLRDSLAALQAAPALASAAVPTARGGSAPRARATTAAPTRTARAPQRAAAPAVVAPPPAILPAPTLPASPTTSIQASRPDSALARRSSPQ